MLDKEYDEVGDKSHQTSNKESNSNWIWSFDIFSIIGTALYKCSGDQARAITKRGQARDVTRRLNMFIIQKDSYKERSSAFVVNMNMCSIKSTKPMAIFVFRGGWGNEFQSHGAE